jgi:hypothetical protein
MRLILKELLRIKKNSIRFALLFSIIMGFSQLKTQDYLISCYYCHMDIIVEMKSKATLHWDSGVNCEACHEESGEHIDVEDNSIKPDLVWSDSTVQILCKSCHERPYYEFQESKHASWYCSDEKPNTNKIISCVTCHGAHGFKHVQEIEKLCIDCHSPLPEPCSLNPQLQKTSGETLSCHNCHQKHSLEMAHNESNN